MDIQVLYLATPKIIYNLLFGVPRYAELFEKKMDRVTAAFKIVRENPAFMVQHMAQRVQMGDMFEHNGIFLHFTMMLNYIKSQGDAEQQKFWYEKAQNGDFIAAYCQTGGQ